MHNDRSEWIDQALCASSELRKVNAWDSDHLEYRDLAIDVCSRCPVRRKCYDDAVTDSESDGIRAGVLFKMRSAKAFREDPDFGIPDYQEVQEL